MWALWIPWPSSHWPTRKELGKTGKAAQRKAGVGYGHSQALCREVGLEEERALGSGPGQLTWSSHMTSTYLRRVSRIVM